MFDKLILAIAAYILLAFPFKLLPWPVAAAVDLVAIIWFVETHWGRYERVHQRSDR